MKQLIVIIFSLICFNGIAQTTYPSGTIPSPRGDSAWAQYGYIRPLVLGHMVAGDTAIRPKFIGAQRFWQNAGVDTAIWTWVGTRWYKTTSVSSGGGGSGVQSVTGISPIDVDNTDPQNPIVSYLGDTTRVFIFEAPLQATIYGDTILVWLDTTGAGDDYNAIHTYGWYIDRFYPLNENPAGYLTYDSASGLYMDTAYERNDSIFGAKNGDEFFIAVVVGGGGSGTVTDFTSGDLSPLFTTSVATSTTTPALSFALSNATAWQIFRRGSGTGAPSYGGLLAEHLNTTYSNGNMLITDGSGNLSWTTAGSVVTPSALTKVDDTNVTLTLGGTPATALLQATSLTLGWTGLLSVPRGGTGIGTTTAYGILTGGTTATGAFQNAGTGTAGQLYYSNGSAALGTWTTPNYVVMDSVAIVRYGTTNPNNLKTWNTSSANSVVGSANTTTSNDSTNYKIGYLSGNVLTTGYGNIMMGSKVAQSATTPNFNVMIGHQIASNAVFTGTGNVFIGTSSSNAVGMARSATTAAQNTVVGGIGANGVPAGQALTQGMRNTFIGNEAGGRTTTSSDNTAVGKQALFTNITGASNTAVGVNALLNSTVSSNTAVGALALSNLTTGSADAFGAGAGQSFTIGSRNFAMGGNSFTASGTTNEGSDNVGLGGNSGQHAGALGIIQTNRNLFAGTFAGQGAINGTNDNTFLGYKAGAGTTSPGSTMSGDNNIAIGSAAVIPSLTSADQITLWVGASGGTGGYNALTRFTGGQWLLNNTTSAVTSAPHSSAYFEMNGVAGGFRPPAMTTTEKNNISSPTEGLIVYDLTLHKLCVYTGSAWETITSL